MLLTCTEHWEYNNLRELLDKLRTGKETKVNLRTRLNYDMQIRLLFPQSISTSALNKTDYDEPKTMTSKPDLFCRSTLQPSRIG